MDEDLSVKAPVTRLRRRMSVESEDSSLPTTPSTPTKKRATRLAAKPQLELIDEVATENVPKRTTRKAAVKENVEAELNTGTPTAVTPSRRSTRIRSNTSILLETTAQNIESPRAKRATRRNSQLGSDNESAAVTPARQTRRTRKTSATSADKPAGDENVVEVTSTNTEELEKASETDNHSPSTRKSPRLNKKGGKVNDETDKTNKESNKTVKDSVNTNIALKESTPVNKSLNDSVTTNKALKESTPVKESRNDSENTNKSLEDSAPVNELNKILNDSVNANKSLKEFTPVKESNKKVNDSMKTNKSLMDSTLVEESNEKINDSKSTNKSLKDSTPVKNKKEININNEPFLKINKNDEQLSTSSTNLIYEIKTKTIDKNVNDLNKSTSSIEKITNNLKNKRNRTKSWTTLSCPSNVEFISDNEDAKEKVKKKSSNTSIISGAGDASTTNNTTEMTCQRDTKSPKKSVNMGKTPLLNIVKPCVVSVTRTEFDKSDTVKLFENSPSLQQPLVLIEDSDSCSADKLIIDIQEDEDQCVPVVVNPTNELSNKQEQSVEPMDIDESMPMNVTIDDFSDKSNNSKEEVEISDKRKSSEHDKSLKNDSINKSKRKTSISNQSASESPKFSMIEEDKNDSVNKSKNSSKINSSTSAHKLNGSSTNKYRTSLISDVADVVDSCESRKSSDKSLRKSSITIDENNAKLNESGNKSKRKSSLSVINPVIQNDSKKSIDNTEINLAMSTVEKQNDNTKKSKSNTSTSLNNSTANEKILIDENNVSKSSNKSKRYSISQTDSQNLENKSTLVISQLKDVSTNDCNNIMSPNVTNNELSKSLNGPDKKNKGIDKKNISLNNYSTSTPIQQKPFQKLAMQINTSIIKPEDKNNANEKTLQKNFAKEAIDSETDDEIKFKNKKEMVVLSKRKFSRAPSSSDSSESDIELKAPIKRPIKNTPIKNLGSSDSDEESDTNSQQNDKKFANKKLGNRSNSELKTEAKLKTRNKVPTPDSSNSGDSVEDASNNRSKMINDEASEASDDYESGDSQDKEDRRYEKENEILEKGETLDSVEELSNDSDYEKDSFLVSSDAEDNDMLSGSGDDLSMSDNELTMSAKSKKKFNERKLKQQKKASREMYEARHTKNADNSKTEVTKSKKDKRQRLESSNLESENENVQRKKSNRLRIDSSQDDSTMQSDADETIGIKKKKSKRLSESVHDTTTNEVEVTICNQSTTEKSDPLSVAIKQEPKTPQKNFDISTVAINDKIEEVEMDVNASILRRNESLDPLQATIAADLDDNSSSSDNMEIVQMYDSVLSNLKTQTNKIKTADTSLNLNKKSKKSKDPVIDQLNLTQTKKSKSNKNKTEEKQLQAENAAVINFEENSSDSIDVKLLFPEDSNDSETNANHFNPNIQAETADNFIPLKRTDAQTNIPGNNDMSVSDLNVSKKKKKRKSSNVSLEEISNIPINSEEPEDSNIKIIIDTKGAHEEAETPVVLTNSSKKKKKNKSLNESQALEIAGDVDCTDGIAETVVEALFTHEKDKKKNKNKNFDVSVNNMENSFTVTESNSKKSKKKTMITTEFVENQTADNTVVEEIPVNVSIKSDKKKKKNKHDTSQIIEPLVEAKSSAKKSKTSLCVEDVEPQMQNTDSTDAEEIPVNVSIKSDKKKKKNKHDTSQIIEPLVEAKASAKKSKTSLCVEDLEPQVQNTEPEEIPAEISMTSEKKKKKKNKQNMENSQTIVDKTEEESDNEAPMETSYKSEKKSDATDTLTDDAPTSNENKKHKKNKNKKNKNKNLSQSMEKSGSLRTTEQELDGSAKRKRTFYESTQTEDITNAIPLYTLTTSNEKKKRKVQEDIECIADKSGADDDSSKKSKNKKDKNRDNIEQDMQQNTKKRKYSDEDNEQKVSKVSKQNSFDKIHVPTLPDSIINQLSEKPQNKFSKNKKKAKVAAIATMPFVVEDAERRKNKPSNYLEQSVYLNDTPMKTKQKRIKDKPKVLPFIPTALTSDSGYTSQFNVNVLPTDTQFVAQASNVTNFKESFLVTQRIKKMGTLERCKIHRSRKISKF